MVFEDYGTYFSGSAGDEELWTEAGEGECTLFYQARTKDPPRETKYGIFLDRDGLVRAPDIARTIERLEQDPVRLENLGEDTSGPLRPKDLGVAFLESLRPLVVSAKYFELLHLTSATLDAVLRDVGFVDVRHLDVGDDDVGAVRFQMLPGQFALRKRHDAVTVLLQRRLQPRANNRLIIDDQYV